MRGYNVRFAHGRGVAVLALGAIAASMACAAEVTIYRDTWGVPHVFAESTPGAAYGLGYALAEDRINDVFINIRIATGQMAEVFGADHIQRDLIMRLFKNAQRCEAYWKTAPPEVREWGDAYVAGVNAYLAKHPDRKPPFALDLQGWHCLAVSRAMILNWPIEAVFEELARKSSQPPFGSNSFAVAPSRSAENCAMVMTDPHLTWEGLAVFYEARVHAPDIDMCGYWLVGSPLPALGHGRHVAWACTTGGPDTSDVFALKLNPDNPLQYEYENGWTDFVVDSIRIDVQGADPFVQPVLFTELGPVLEPPADGVAYCGASPYWTADRLFEQSIAMVQAKDCEEFYEALTLNQLMEQNILFADRQGNIQYVRLGNTPIRPDGFNWAQPVPWSRESAWKGTHDFADLVQLKNPPQGYMQNCNNSPEFMLSDSPLRPEKYPSYIYHVSWDQHTPRGDRLLALLDADTSISKEDAMRYTTDVYDILAVPWQKALQTALRDASTTKHAVPEDILERVLQWDGEFTRESTAAPIIRYWRLNCEGTQLPRKISQGEPLTSEEMATLVNALEKAVKDVSARYGSLDVAWGEINLIGRGGKYFPSPGAEFGSGGQLDRTETVMDVGTRELEPGSGKYVAHDGSSAMMISLLHADGIESYSLVNWGQSGDPESEHYVDQAEKLYSERQFKPTWFKKAELMKHVESETTLTIE